MATKEDILEQLVEEFLIHRGYFVRHNVKYLPRKDHIEFKSKLDSNHSDIDVLAFNPLAQGADRVSAVSCKSWQSGFDPAVKIAEIEQKNPQWQGGMEGLPGTCIPQMVRGLYRCHSSGYRRNQFHLRHRRDETQW